MDAITITTFSMLAVVLAASAWVTASVMRNIDKIGHFERIKSASISRALFNFYAVAVLCLVIVVRYLKLIEPDLFIALLVGVVGGLGFKLAVEVKHGRTGASEVAPDDEGH
jgi:hypothetical protein